MRFLNGTVFNVVLAVILALTVFTGAVALAAAPPAGTAVQVQTFGALPMVVFNLTLSPINMTVSTNQAAAYSAGGFPIAAGWSGVYYPQAGGVTANFNNVLAPSAPVDGVNSASLMPVATVAAPNNVAFTGKNNFMNLFTLFPSWTAPPQGNNADFYQTQYVALGDVANQGAAAASYNVISGYPSGNAKSIGSGGNNQKLSVPAYAHTAAQPSLCNVNLNLMVGGQTAATYKININSLGKGTSTYIAPPAGDQTSSILEVAHGLLDILVDAFAFAASDGLAIAAIITGIPGTISGIQDQLNENATANVGNPATNAGINVTAQAGVLPNNAVLALIAGDNNALKYQVQSPDGSFANLPLEQQNAVLLATWRQKPENTGSLEFSSADLVFVGVVNNAIFAASQIQQFVNSSPAQLAQTKAAYTPSRAQSQDTAKLLSILSSLYKNHPQDAKTLLNKFGVNGEYAKIKKDPNALRELNNELKTLFEKHKGELPAIEQYLTRLARK